MTPRRRSYKRRRRQRTRKTSLRLRSRTPRRRVDAEQIAGWLKAGNERRRGPWAARRSTPSSTAPPKRRAAVAGSTRRKTPPPRRSRPSRDTIKDRVSIHERPANIDARTRLVIGRATSSSASAHGPCSFYERKSRVTLAARLVGKTAAETISVMLAVFAASNPRCASPLLTMIRLRPARSPKTMCA